MNKDRAKHIETLEIMRDNYKDDLQETQTTHWTDNKTTYDKRVEILTDTIQALDYAIEQMENDNLLKRLENGECCKHSSNKVVAYNREWLEDNLEMEFDLLKFARDTTSKMSDDELAERLSKGLEPYVRSDKE